MSETLQIWLFAGGFTGILGSYIWQWKHRESCEAKRIRDAERFTNLDASVKHIFAEIGTAHNEGMRHRLHKAEGRIRLLIQKSGMEVGDDD